MNAGAVQLATNRAQVAHLNSVHGMVLNPANRRLGQDLLALAALNSMTLLGAEVVGRAYGGGMLKLEPREAAVLPVPSPAVLRGVAGQHLRTQRVQLTALLRQGHLDHAVAIIDRIVLGEGVGATTEQVAALDEARRGLAGRRVARGGGPVPPRKGADAQPV